MSVLVFIMADQAISIRIAAESDLPAVVDVHLRAFPGFFLSRLGKGFLREYYRLYLSPGHHLLLATNMDGLIIGFASGSSKPEAFYTDMKLHAYRFVPSLLHAVVFEGMWRMVLSKALSVFKKSSVNTSVERPLGYAELASIAVSPESQGRSLGRSLLDAFIKLLRDESGAKGLYLTTDASDNERVVAFYERYGFSLIDEFKQSENRAMRAYVLEID